MRIVRDPSPCRIMSYTLRDRCDETNRADEATVRQVAREISARAHSFLRPSFDALHYEVKCIIIRIGAPIGDVKRSVLQSTASCN